MGEFYEAVGLDAVLLMEHCGLNPMGRPSPGAEACWVPRAGAPVPNLLMHLGQLVEGAGLDVVRHAPCAVCC